jgi:2-keto-4-pentenoate hydratase/2-oxohepta-3-ene-1,7-dioic acid hydratase in catechol pathway
MAAVVAPVFGLGTLLVSSGAGARRAPLAAMRIGDRYWPLAAAARAARVAGVPAQVFDLFDDWPAMLPRLARVAAAIEAGRVPEGLAVPERRARLADPIHFPRKCFCTGANYADHLAEMNASSIRKVPGEPPFFFMKPPTTCLVGPGKTVHIPAGSTNFDWEVELVVVFGKAGRNIPERRAMDYVAGYSVGVDFTSRNQMVVPESFFKFNFTLGKCQDSMSPMGPVFVPKAFLDGGDTRIALSVNGVKKQDTRTSRMIYSLPEQIAGISRAIAIEPGDVMFTGSPAGVGMPRGEKLAAGDVVRIEADAIGAMEVVIQPPFAAKRR